MADFQAATRLVAMMASSAVPPALLRQAALGSLSLPFADRLALVLYLAYTDSPCRAAAQDTLGRIDQQDVAVLLARPDCPDFLRAVADARELVDEHQALLAAAATAAAESEPFALVEASAEERAALASVPSAPAQAGADNPLNRIAKMTVPERVRRALLGSREERLLLVRDSNKIVQRAVVTSPRLTESDVELIAGMRNVSDDVLRYIGQHRRWRQSMVIVKNLANNPRTPLEIGLNLAKHLFPNDLRQLAANKNINETLRRAAAKLVTQRQA